MTSFKKKHDGMIAFTLCLAFYLFIPAVESINLVTDFYTQNGQFGVCSDVITGENSAFLRSHVGAYQFGSLIGYRANEDCAVGFDAGAGKQVLVKFLRFALQDPTNSECQDYLTVEELGRDDNFTYCGSQAITPYVSDEQNITLIFHSDSTTELSGFKILLTSFRTATGACPSGEFKCDSTRCIDDSLKCDGVPHCVDGTDEENDEAGCSWFDHVVGAVLSLGEHTILAIGILGGSVIFIIITAVVVYHVVIKKKKNRVLPITPTKSTKPAKAKAKASPRTQDSVSTTSDDPKPATSNKTTSSSKSSDKQKKATTSSSKKTNVKNTKKAEPVEDDVDW